MSEDTKPERGFQMSDPPRQDGEGLARMDFATFVLSLAASGLVHLGRAPDLSGAIEPAEPSLPLARQTIDTLEMLQEKTRGNLTDDEEKLLQSVLYELRMEYVRVEQGSKDPA